MTSPCIGCGQEITFEPVFTGPSANKAYCEQCLAAIAQEQDKARLQRDLTAEWLKICPPRYHDTVLPLLPYADRAERALQFRIRDGLGLNLWGYPDTGKTRTMLMVLSRCHYASRLVVFLECGRFTELCEANAYHTAVLARRLSRCDVLAFDDMDKLSLTKHQEKLFFGIVDSRMSHHRPTLFTHNSTALQLTYQFKTCGESLTRRLRQFCHSIHFPPRPTVPQSAAGVPLDLSPG